MIFTRRRKSRNVPEWLIRREIVLGLSKNVLIRRKLFLAAVGPSACRCGKVAPAK